MQVMPDFRAAIKLAVRARFVSFGFWIAVALCAAVLLAAEFSARQPATVGLDVGLSVIRLALPVLGVLLLQELLSREFDRRFFLSSLTYPRSRHLFLAGRLLAVALLVIALLSALGALLAGLTVWIGQSYAQATPPSLGLPYLVTLLFVALDLLAILAIGALLAVMASTPSFVLVGTLGFMLVARSFSVIVDLLSRDSTLVADAKAYQSSLNVIGFVLPDLAALDVRMIALYGQWSFMPNDWVLRMLAVGSYTLAAVALAMWALSRKRFA